MKEPVQRQCEKFAINPDLPVIETNLFSPIETRELTCMYKNNY